MSAVIGDRRAVPESPLQTTLSQQRRFLTVRTRLDDYRKVRRFHGGTVNDVVMATVTGALRAWLMTRAESVQTSRQIRAMVPMGVDRQGPRADVAGQPGGRARCSTCRSASPVPSCGCTRSPTRSRRTRTPARRSPRCASSASAASRRRRSTRWARGWPRTTSQKGFNLVVTNVPGPAVPALRLAAPGCSRAIPSSRCCPGHALAIGVTSYDGGVHYGITADRDAIPDIDVVGQCITESLAELVDTTAETRMRAPRGRSVEAAAGRLT